MFFFFFFGKLGPPKGGTWFDQSIGLEDRDWMGESWKANGFFLDFLPPCYLDFIYNIHLYAKRPLARSTSHRLPWRFSNPYPRAPLTFSPTVSIFHGYFSPCAHFQFHLPPSGTKKAVFFPRIIFWAAWWYKSLLFFFFFFWPNVATWPKLCCRMDGEKIAKKKKKTLTKLNDHGGCLPPQIRMLGMRCRT